MSDIEILNEMISSEATISLEEHFDRNKVVLTESAPPAYNVEIFGMPEVYEVIVIKADMFLAPKYIFSDAKGECKRADFVIISEADDHKVIVILEMKAGNSGSEKEIIQQLKGAKCFVAYCREIGQEFWNYPSFLKDYEYRFVSIKHISIPKRPTRSSNKRQGHDRPETMLKITSPKGLQFRQLVGQ